MCLVFLPRLDLTLVPHWHWFSYGSHLNHLGVQHGLNVTFFVTSPWCDVFGLAVFILDDLKLLCSFPSVNQQEISYYLLLLSYYHPTSTCSWFRTGYKQLQNMSWPGNVCIARGSYPWAFLSHNRLQNNFPASCSRIKANIHSLPPSLGFSFSDSHPWRDAPHRWQAFPPLPAVYCLCEFEQTAPSWLIRPPGVGGLVRADLLPHLQREEANQMRPRRRPAAQLCTIHWRGKCKKQKDKPILMALAFLFSIFFFFFCLMVPWHATRPKCHISNAKWIIAPTQLNQMPSSDLRPSTRSGLVNLHQALVWRDWLFQESLICFFFHPSLFN